MNKAQTLLNHLLSSPLKLKPNNVLLSVANCQVLSSVGDSNQHFEFNYDADLWVMNFTGNADVLSFFILNWLDNAQPHRKETAFTMASDMLDSKKADIHIRIPLTETIKVKVDATGTSLIHVDEPSIEQRLETKDWKLFVNDTLTTQWTQNV